jgi:hypothetical protein
MEHVNVPIFRYGIETYISDWIPDYSFDKTLNSESKKRRLKNFMDHCPVYLVAENQEELDRLASIKPRRSEMYKAILHLRWQQFQRVWGLGP